MQSAFHFMGRIKGDVVCIRGDYIIARANVRRGGYKVYTPSGKYVGRVVRIFGPVEHPYIKVRIERKWGVKVEELVIRGDRGGRKR